MHQSNDPWAPPQPAHPQHSHNVESIGDHTKHGKYVEQPAWHLEFSEQDNIEYDERSRKEIYKRKIDKSKSRLKKASQRKQNKFNQANKHLEKYRHQQHFIPQQAEGTGLEGASVDMAKVGMYDNLADVLEVVDISNGDVTTMTAEELKQRIKEQIDSQVDKFYSDVMEQQRNNEKANGSDSP